MKPLLVTPIVLAAGCSRRMGRTKALLELGGRTCLERALRACREGGAGTPVVVLGHDAEAVRAALPAEVPACLNPDHAGSGPAVSLQRGLELLPEGAGAFLLYPVDFPLVTGRDVGALLERWEAVREAGRRIVVPSHAMRRGHPALFARSLVPEFRALEPDAPLHRVLRAHQDEVEHLVVENPGILMNMDTPEDYRRCLEALEGSPR